MTGIQEQKKILRNQLIKTRQEMPRFLFGQECQLSSGLLIEIYSKNKFSGLVSFMAKDSEIDLSELHDHIWSKNQSIYFPRVVSQQELQWGACHSTNDLSEGHYGIMEPNIQTQSLKDLPNNLLVVVPGLGFSKAGGRIGWGMGYYDRQLEQMQAKSFHIVGVALSCQLCEVIPQENHDFQFKNLILGGEILL